MELLTFLGTANAVSDSNHENSYFLVQSGSTNVLVDCPGNPISRLLKVGFSPIDLTDLILTHFHPDHVSGLPLLLMDLWLMGRHDPLYIYGLSVTLDKAKQMMDLFSWRNWKDRYPVEFIEVADIENFALLKRTDLTIISSPVKHLIPNIGLRFEFPESGKVIVYSSDSEPCQAVRNLATDATVLIHESAGNGTGHSSPEQCGEMAQNCNVDELYLIHYPANSSIDLLISSAKSNYNGQIFVAEDFNKILLA